MVKYHIGKIVEEKPIATRGDDKYRSVIEYWNGTTSGYEENETEVAVGVDGSVSLSNNNEEGFIYLQPEQAQILKRILNEQLP
jgi:hypothetical protein